MKNEHEIEDVDADDLKRIMRRAATELIARYRTQYRSACGDPGGKGPDAYDDCISDCKQRLETAIAARDLIEKLDTL